MKTRVLVANDDPALKALFGQALNASERFEVIFAHEGAQTLGMLRACRPDFVFVGEKISGMSSGQVCRLVKSNPATAHAKVIFIQGDDASVRLQVQGRHGYPDAYLDRPVSKEGVLETIRRHLPTVATL